MKGRDIDRMTRPLKPISLAPERLVGYSRVEAAHLAEREKCAQVPEKFLPLAKCEDEVLLLKAVASAIRTRVKVAELR